jgi:hypothetical protein
VKAFAPHCDHRRPSTDAQMRALPLEKAGLSP